MVTVWKYRQLTLYLQLLFTELCGDGGCGDGNGLCGSGGVGSGVGGGGADASGNGCGVLELVVKWGCSWWRWW